MPDSDVVFGIFKILGYNFSPRFRDLDDQRFWRASLPGVEAGTYEPLEVLARNRVNLNKVITHWPDMLRVASSLVTNQVRAYDLLRMFGRKGRPTPLGQAFAEYGRIAETLHLLAVVDPVDDAYRRQMNRQLTGRYSCTASTSACGRCVTRTQSNSTTRTGRNEPGSSRPRMRRPDAAGTSRLACSPNRTVTRIRAAAAMRHYQASSPAFSWKVPVGPSLAMVAMRTMTSALS
jgi:hypothetical protein